MTDRCKACGQKKRRSNQQNRRYWLHVALCVPFTYNGRRWTKLQWHNYFKDLYIVPTTVELPDGRRVVRDPESSELDKDDFSVFTQKVEVWCAEHELYLPELEG